MKKSGDSVAQTSGHRKQIIRTCGSLPNTVGQIRPKILHSVIQAPSLKQTLHGLSVSAKTKALFSLD